MCALLSLRPDFPWSRRCRRTCPPPYHNSSLLRNFDGGIRRVRRKMRRWADRNRGVTLTQFPPFPRRPLHADPLLLCQPSGTLTLPGPLGHSRTKNITQLPGLNSQKTSMLHTFQWLLGKWHKFMTDGWCDAILPLHLQLVLLCVCVTLIEIGAKPACG